MKFISLEKVVNKLNTFLAIFFISFAAVCQNHSVDSQFLNSLSESTLEKKVTFSWNGGNLADALNKINAEYSIKFSFSNSSIADIRISPCNYKDIKLSDLFSFLFKNTGFNYVLIGRIVAVYKDESNSGSSVVSDSTDDKITGQKEKHRPVYTSSNPPMLSRRDRMMLSRLYRKEMRWAARYHRQKESNDSDTLNKKEKNHSPSYQQEDLRYFVSVDLGLQKNYLKYKSNSQLPWKEDISWNNRAENHILPAFLFGMTVKGFMFSTGFRVQNVTIQNSFKELKKGAPKPPSSPQPFESTNVFVTERYSSFSIPISLIYSKFRKNLWGGIGGGICFNFISGNESMKNKLKKYYNDSTDTKDYSDNFKKFTTSMFGDISIGYKLKNNIILTGGLTYIHSLNAVFENSLFNLSIHSMVYRVGLYYRFNIYGKRQ